VGLNPSKLKVSTSKGSAFVRFTQWMDTIGVHYYSFVNLSGDPNWDFRFTTIDKQFIIDILSEHDKIVCWGDRVTSYVKRLGFECFTLPHPSGLNRKINNHKYITHTLKECKEYLNEDCNCTWTRH